MGIPEAVIDATLKVIQERGVKVVTVRRVADAIGRSTTVVTHYFRTRADLLRAALDCSFAESRAEALHVISESDDQLWAFLEWSVSNQHRGVWVELVTAYVAGIDAVVSERVDEFLEWWDAQLMELLEDRVAEGRSERQVCDVIGIIVDGVIFSCNRPVASGLSADAILRIAIAPLLNR